MPMNIPYSNHELREAAPDYLAARAGVMVANPHPYAEQMMMGTPLSLRDIAEAFGMAAGREMLGSSIQSAAPAKIVGLGMGTDDFRTVLTDTLRHLVYTKYDAAAAAHRALCRLIPVKDFKSVGFPSVDVSDDAVMHKEDSERRFSAVEISEGLTAQLFTWVKRLLVTREAVINDDLALIATVFEQAAIAIARTEAKQLYSLLESNPTLSDDAPMFDVSLGNVVSGSMDATGLGAAMAALRNQLTASGNMANNEASILLTPSADELTALALVKSISVDKPRLRVVAAPWLASGAWYTLADPNLSPVLGLLHLEGNKNGRTVNVETKPGMRNADGVGAVAWSDFGTAALGRVGIVKVQA